MEKSSESESEPTKANKILLYILFYSFGVVTVVPSNFFTTATDVSNFF